MEESRQHQPNVLLNTHWSSKYTNKVVTYFLAESQESVPSSFLLSSPSTACHLLNVWPQTSVLSFSFFVWNWKRIIKTYLSTVSGRIKRDDLCEIVSPFMELTKHSDQRASAGTPALPHISWMTPGQWLNLSLGLFLLYNVEEVIGLFWRF